MSRMELIEIIYALEQRERALISEKEQLEKKLKEREILIKESGSIAEAVLGLNKIFEIAQETADQYVASVTARYADAEEKIQHLEEEAEEKRWQLDAEAADRSRQMALRAEEISRWMHAEPGLGINPTQKAAPVQKTAPNTIEMNTTQNTDEPTVKQPRKTLDVEIIQSKKE